MHDKIKIYLLLLTIVISGCVGTSRLAAVPETRTYSANVLGIDNVRFWPTHEDDSFTTIVMDAIDRSSINLNPENNGQSRNANLVLSSGGDGGAFSAGLLVGWSAAGNRPKFSFVTGISTGALIAPFAFLGPDYDDTLKYIYTNISTKNVYRLNVLGALFSDATADSAPLAELIERYIDDALLKRIAEEYSNGRLLLIGTTNLDARLPVMWNMGAIASSKHPEAPNLFRKILLASASVPSLLPPVMIEVESSGAVYHEMHVDGGITEQVYAYPDWISQKYFDGKYKRFMEDHQTDLYVIWNSRMQPEWSQVERQTMKIGHSTIEAMTHSLGKRDIHRIFIQAKRDGINFNLAAIDTDFRDKNQMGFDTAYMRALFEYGYKKALNGYPWKKIPPGLLGRKTDHLK